MLHVLRRRRTFLRLALLTLLTAVITAGGPSLAAGPATAEPGGRLSGRVVDHASGDPVGGANVVLTGPSSETTVTDDDGRYVVMLAAGDYELTVTAFGFDDVQETLQMPARTLLAHDVQLDASPSVVLHGHVADASGEGWPLYAHVEIPGTPLQTFTDPATGDYRLVVPGGHSYDVRATADYPGYRPQTDTVQVAGATAHDFGVSVDVDTCSAPGYHRTGGFQEGFDGGSTPQGWTVDDPFGTGILWRFDDPGGRGNHTGGVGGFATIDSVDQTDRLPDGSLVSPAIDLSGSAHPVLEFATDLNTAWPALASADLSLDAGATWTSVWHVQAPVDGPQTVRVPVPAAAGSADARIRFHYKYGPPDWYWQVDDVYVGDVSCGPTPSGLVVGHTRSSLTGRAMNGLDVTADGTTPVTVTSRATPEDTRLPDGFYWLVTAPGQHRLTTTAREYADGTAQPQVEAGQVQDVDLGLASGRLAATPRTIRVELRPGEQATRQVTVVNTGDGPASFSLDEVEDAPPPSAPGPSSGSPAVPPVQRVPAEISPLPDRDHPALQPPAAPSVSGSVSDSDDGAWHDLAAYPFAVRDTAAGSLHGTVYSFGGSGLDQEALRSSFKYDDESDTWAPIADLPEPRQKPAGAFIDDKFIVAGGWGADEHPVAETVVYDPATDTWSSAAPNPTPYGASGTAVLDGAMYVVGGCMDSDCGRTDVLRYDPAADTWTRLADYPQKTSWTSCGGIRGKVYCTGGLGPDADKLLTFAYDPESDSWSRVADQPLDLWASAYTVVEDRLVVTGGAALDSSVLTNEAFAYDPVSDSWATLPPNHHPLLRSSGACGFVKIGGQFEAWPGDLAVEELKGYDDCRPSTDLAWLSSSPDHSQIGPGDSARVELHLDAAELEPGAHVVYLRVREDTPYDVPDVRIRLVVRR